MILLEVDFLGHLPIGQLSFKTYLPSKKIYLSWTIRHVFLRALQFVFGVGDGVFVFIFSLTSKRKEKAILFIRFAFFKGVTDIITMKVSQEDLENTALSTEQKGIPIFFFTFPFFIH